MNHIAMKINNVLDILESWAPKEIAEDFDNVGLLIGDPSRALKNILVTLDATEDVVEEAIKKGCKIIITDKKVKKSSPIPDFN